MQYCCRSHTLRKARPLILYHRLAGHMPVANKTRLCVQHKCMLRRCCMHLRLAVPKRAAWALSATGLALVGLQKALKGHCDHNHVDSPI